MHKNKTINHHSLRGNLIYQTNQIERLINEGKIRQAELMINDLINIYPDDSRLLYFQLRILAFDGRYAEAYAISDLINRNDEKYYYYYFAVLAILNNDLERMEYYYNMYFKNDDYKETISERISQQAIKIYLQNIFEPNKKVIVTNYDDQLRDSYFIRQIADYSLEDTYRHIVHSHVYSKKPNKSKFNPRIDIRKLLNDTKELIEANKENSHLNNLQQVYYIYYPECGKFSESLDYNLDYLMASTIYNTTDILSIYPVRGNSRYYPLAFPQKEEEKSLKRVSQIDKFNMRYGKK